MGRRRRPRRTGRNGWGRGQPGGTAPPPSRPPEPAPDDLDAAARRSGVILAAVIGEPSAVAGQPRWPPHRPSTGRGLRGVPPAADPRQAHPPRRRPIPGRPTPRRRAALRCSRTSAPCPTIGRSPAFLPPSSTCARTHMTDFGNPRMFSRTARPNNRARRSWSSIHMSSRRVSASQSA